MEQNMKKITVWLLAMVLTVPMLAQGPEGIDKEKHKQARAQMKAYVEQNILPVMIENRMDFEDFLSAEEKETIADLRVRQQELKEKGKAHRAEMRNKRQSGADFQPSEEQRNQRRLARKEMRLITTAAYEIIDEHEDFFLAMEGDLADKKKTWKKDMKAIMEAAMGSEERPGHARPGRHARPGQGRPGNSPEGMRRGRRGGHHGPAGHGGPGRHGMKEMFAPVAFVLMDPSNPQLPGDDLAPVAIFPNPTAAKQSISVELRNAGKVKVELVDADGKLLDTLFEENLGAGSNQIDVDLSDYSGSQYFYKITTPDGTETKRVLKSPK